MNIEIDIVRKLIHEQFPQYGELKVQPVQKSGHDNRTFHLGDEMIIRLPNGKEYAMQVQKENQWLPYLSKFLSLPISQPLHIGKSNDDYPYSWSILNYLSGETVTYQNIESLNSFAKELRNFLEELQSIPSEQGPQAGQHNFYRGGNLSIYHDEIIKALELLKERLDTKRLEELWNLALEKPYLQKGVWIHGEIAIGNLLVEKGHLCGVIDFGIMGVGDPACDYAIAWTFFDKQSRHIFLANISEDMKNRAMGWALWKALITFDDSNEEIRLHARKVIQEIVYDYKE